MARKTRPDEPCVGCKKPKAAPAPKEPQVVYTITLDSEMERLWRHIAVGTSTCVRMMEQYQAAGMKHLPVEEITDLRDRLTALLENA